MSNTQLIVSSDSEINIEVACDQIGQAWHTTIDSLFKVVTLIRECLGKKGFKELQSELDRRGIMKASVFSMFKTIAQNPMIDVSIKDRLPPAYNALYYIAKIDDDNALKDVIENGGISRDTTIEEAKKIYSEIMGESKEEYESFKTKSEIVSLASMKVDRTLFKKNKAQIFSLIEQLNSLGVNVKINDELR